jgi:hypothetical protein
MRVLAFSVRGTANDGAQFDALCAALANAGNAVEPLSGTLALLLSLAPLRKSAPEPTVAILSLPPTVLSLAVCRRFARRVPTVVVRRSAQAVPAGPAPGLRSRLATAAERNVETLFLHAADAVVTSSPEETFELQTQRLLWTTFLSPAPPTTGGPWTAREAGENRAWPVDALLRQVQKEHALRRRRTLR